MQQVNLISECNFPIELLDKYVSDENKPISENLKGLISQIFESCQYDLSKFEKAIYKDENPEFTAQIKLYLLIDGKFTILKHLFRKAVFKEHDQYNDYANKAVNVYSQSINPLKFHIKIEELKLGENERSAAWAFFEDFPLYKDLLPHYDARSFQKKASVTALHKIEDETINQITRAVEHHLFPYIAGYQKTHTGIPLFETLILNFKVDQDQLLDIALKAYCRCAFRGINARKLPTVHPIEWNESGTPMKKKDFSMTDSFVKVLRFNYWYQIWTGTDAPDKPAFSEHFFAFLKALSTAIERDFGFSAPHPIEIVKLAVEAEKEVDVLLLMDQIDVDNINNEIKNFRSFSQTFKDKVKDNKIDVTDLTQPFDILEVNDNESQILFKWWYKISEKKMPIFNLKVLSIISSSLTDMKVFGTFDKLFKKLIEWTTNIIFKLRMEKRIELELNLNRKLKELCFLVEHIYMHELSPTGEYQNHRFINNYAKLEKWYLIWSENSYPSYTSQVLKIFKTLSPLTEDLPTKWLTPKGLEKKVIDKIRELNPRF